MSIIFMATSLSAVGASALTIGALALRRRLAARAQSPASQPRPLDAFAAEHAALAGLDANAVITETSDTFRWNSLRFNDPRKDLAAIGALQARLTQAAALDPARCNAGFSQAGGQGDDA